MHPVILSLLLLPLVFALLAGTLVVGMRRKSPSVLNAIRRGGRAMKPLVLRRAGTDASPTSVVEHVGRTSGRRYETPVVATPTDEGYAIALPYGTNTDWLKNVVAAGRVTLRNGGVAHELDRPEVVHLGSVDAWFAQKEQRLHRRFGVRDAVVLRTAVAAPV